MQTNQIITNLKQQNLDFEFYPTTDEIINVIKRNLEYCGDILDIGAGNGVTLEKLAITNREGYVRKKFAIEKNPMLRGLINNETMIIGGDLFENTLWDKEVDAIFCNPPFSEFEEWMFKIISEANAKKIFFVIPIRWKQSEKIQSIIKLRKYDVQSLGNYDFLEGERAARCEVEVLMLSVYNICELSDYFDNELSKHFDIEKNSYNYYSEAKEDISQAINDKQVVLGDYVQAIMSLFHNEQDKINATIKSLSEIDRQLFKELNVDLSKIKDLVRNKLNSLNNRYWAEVINKLKPIANRLISSHRKSLLNEISETKINFNATNIYSIVEYVIKTISNKIESQTLEVYNSLIDNANCTNYQSNINVFTNNNFEMKNPSKLNYRIVINKYCAIKKSGCYSGDYPQNLSRGCHEFLSDLCVVANNLGFEINNSVSQNSIWFGGENKEFYAMRNGKEILLMTVRAYINGNMHIKFNTDFNHKLNVIKGKNEGWIHSIDDVMTEFGVSENEAAELFEDMPKLTLNAIKLLQ